MHRRRRRFQNRHAVVVTCGGNWVAPGGAELGQNQVDIRIRLDIKINN